MFHVTYYYAIIMPRFMLADFLALGEARDTEIDVLAPRGSTFNTYCMCDILIA